MFVPEPDDDTDDYPLDIERGELALDQMVRDALGVELPFSPLCRPDCQGLCPVRGGDRNLGECPGHAEVDPRWAALEAARAHAGGALTGPTTNDPPHDRPKERTSMAVPKKKQSKSRGDKRAANWKAKAPAYAECPQCKQPKLSHRVCGTCGVHAGRQAVEVE